MTTKKLVISSGIALGLIFLNQIPVPARTTEPIQPLPREYFREIYPSWQKDDITVTLRTEPPRTEITPTPPPIIQQPKKIVVKPIAKPANTSGFRRDNNVSWYGPGFYGKRTACGLALTKTLKGVAHKTLPCGTLVTFSWKGRTLTVPVVDRGPYITGRQWDLTGGLCVALNHCFTGPIYYRIGK